MSAYSNTWRKDDPPILRLVSEVLRKMIDVDKSVAANGKRVFSELETMLLAQYPGQYVAIEPTSGQYFVDKNMGAAISNGKAIYPHRSFYTVRIGQPIHVPGK